jgi:hypothetical protein
MVELHQKAEVAVDGFTTDATPICYVNGKRYELPSGRGEGTLLQFLRGRLRMVKVVVLLPPNFHALPRLVLFVLWHIQ